MTKAEISALVSEGAVLAKELSKLKAKSERLDEIKESLRQEASGADIAFRGKNGETARVKQIADSMVRTVPVDSIQTVRRLSGRFFLSLFRIAPAKDFELNAYKQLPKEDAAKLVKHLTQGSTPRVSFES